MRKSIVIVCMLIISVVMLGACSNDKKPSASSKNLVIVWYPNESGNDLKDAREEIGKVIEDATGRTVEHKLTTDYAIAIESIANGNAELAFMGAQGYIEARNKNENVVPVVVASGESGTLEDAEYYSWLAVREDEADNYKENGEFSIEPLVDSKFSFVSNSSTSGFKVPSTDIIQYFSQQEQWKDLTAEDLMEGGIFFKEVMYGDSHQGSAMNLLQERADIAAFCDTCVKNYVEVVDGEANRVGAVYQVKENAEDPFTAVPGEKFTLISVTPVLNAPIVANMDSLSEDDLKTIQETLTSEDVTNNEKIFVPKDSEQSGLFTKTANEQFVITDDAWFNPIRELAK